PNGSTDLFTPDDTACVTVLVFDSVATTQLPFCTSFETGSQWVTANAISYRNESSWEIGTPAKPTLNGARTGNTAWTTKLTGSYPEKDSSGLFSSLFRVQPGHCYKLSFHHRFLMEYGSDGGAVDYSVDYGQNWERVDFLGTPNIVLYGTSPNYTYVSELDPNNPGLKGFTGSRTSWVYHEKIIRPDADAQLIVRWRFASDYSANDEGWSIDDVCFEDLGPCAVIGLDDFAVNDLGISQNYPNPSDASTTLEYMIPAQGQVRIVMTDLIGQVVAVLADGSMAAGKHTVQVNTSTLAPGMYQYTFMYEGQQITKRMIVTH
ncbi:MAG: T9SS type A sorting domain-containing protein, partial [Bacteroidota bacterium]